MKAIILSCFLISIGCVNCGSYGKDATSYSNQIHQEPSNFNNFIRNSNEFYESNELRPSSYSLGSYYHYPKKEKVWDLYRRRGHKNENDKASVENHYETIINKNSRNDYSFENSFHDEPAAIRIKEANSEDFSYDESDPLGPSHWGKIDRQCDGNKQSPIPLFTRNATKDFIANSLAIKGFSLMPEAVNVENNGHSMKITFDFKNSSKVQLHGGPLKIAYILDNVHFHWGSYDQEGSEHTLNSIRYSAEIHLVTFNSKYRSLAEAATKSDGIAVLGIFYELDNSAGRSKKENPFVGLINKVIKAESTYVEKNKVFSIKELIKHQHFDYIGYDGSLTTPGCSENVQWLVSTKTLAISGHELTQFRHLRDKFGKKIQKNFRPLQRVNGRRITLYK